VLVGLKNNNNFTSVRPPTGGSGQHQGWFAPALQQASKKQIKAETKNDCNRETLQRNEIVTDNIPIVHCVHTTYNMQNIVRNGTMYKTISQAAQSRCTVVRPMQKSI